MGKHEKKSKRHKEKKSKHKHKKIRRSSSSSSSSEDEWVEKESTKSRTIQVKEKSSTKHTEFTQTAQNEREDWMSGATLLATSSHLNRRQEKRVAQLKEKEAEKYDPSKNVRELNPYWKDGGDGLPSLSKRKFYKPEDNDDDYYQRNKSSNWRKSDHIRNKKSIDYSNYKRKPDRSHYDNKRHNTNTTKTSTSPEEKSSIKATVTSSCNLNELELNEIAAKLIKAEILGQTNLVNELKEKLEHARQNKKTEEKAENEVVLLRTDSKGLTVPLQKPKTKPHTSGQRNTHDGDQRSKYYADDDEYSLKEMFENEKFNSTTFDEKEFIWAAKKSNKKGDDIDDIFVDKIRNQKPAASVPTKMRDSAVTEYRKDMRVLENCNRCIQNEAMQKHLMISMGETIYLSLPPHEPLTDHHCLLIPVRHVYCSTQLDENEWSELMDFRKSLTKMFAAQGQDVIFYETRFSKMRSHMCITCVPVPKEEGDVAPIYFKKAIEECETEWSMNKKLINLAGKDIRKAVPKGLPYFFVSFGMNEGFAHIIEDKDHFPKYFGAEVIGGILDIPHTVWRHPREQDFKIQTPRVMSFSEKWADYDCTK